MTSSVPKTASNGRAIIGSPSGFSGPLPPEHFNMAAYVIGRAASTVPGKIALIVYDNAESAVPSETWTFAQIERAVLRIAQGLRERGLKKGDRLLIRLDNTSTYALMFFGAIAAGLVPLATSVHLTPDEARFLATDSNARAVALAEHLVGAATAECNAGIDIIKADDVAAMLCGPEASGYADTNANDPAYMVYTSGTTANPKGVVHAQRAAWGRRPMYQGWYGITPDDRMLHAGAFNWTFTLGSGLTDPWANGATAIIYTGEKSPDIWPRLIRRTKATLFAAVPGLFRQILKYARAGDLADLERLRHGLMAGETPPPSLLNDWLQATGRPLYEALGMSEISTYISTSPVVAVKPGSVGCPQPGRTVAILPEDAAGGQHERITPVRIGEPGLLAVHTSDPGLMLGYWQRPDEDAEVRSGAWFVGGDLAAMDAEGYVRHLGRANDIMKALGYRVAPQEVEAVLARHPAVGEVACAERQVSNSVSVIAAYIVPASPEISHDEDAVLTYAREHLAPYKVPRKIIWVERLPRTANGKILRRALETAPPLRSPRLFQ